METQRIHAIITAEGSALCGGKLPALIEIEGRPAVLRTAECFHASDVRSVAVVGGYGFEKLGETLKGYSVTVARNPHFRLGRLSSVQLGIQALATPPDWLFVLPAEYPLVRRQTVGRLLAERGRGGPEVLYPSFGGERGFPVLLGRRCIEKILTVGPFNELEAFLERYESSSRSIPCPDEATCLSLDSEAGYRRLAGHLAFRQIPTRGECVALLRAHGAGQTEVRHGETVGALGRAIAEYLNERESVRLDVELVAAAGMLHDIGRDFPFHAQTGAAILRREGFPVVSEVVGTHADMELPDGDSWRVSEKEIVFLASKLVEGDHRVDLEDAASVRGAKRRIETARRLQLRVGGPARMREAVGS